MKRNIKSGFTTLAAIGFTYLALSGSPETIKAQSGPYRPFYRPSRPIFREMGYGVPGLSYDSSINEREGKRIIHNHFIRDNVPFRMDKPLRFRADGRIFELIVDFQLTDPRRSENPIVIEYRSLEDKQIAQYNEINYQLHREFVNREIELIKMDWTLTEWQKQRMIADYLYQLNINSGLIPEEPSSEADTLLGIGYKIPRPWWLLNKEDILKKYEKIGGKVLFIERKDTKEEIETELDSIVEDATKDFILREEQAIEIIARRLNQERIPYRTNTIFEINGVKIRPNFLVFPEDGKLPVVVEYLGPNERQINRKIRDCVKYKQKGGQTYVIEQTNKEGLSNKLDDIVKDIQKII